MTRALLPRWLPIAALALLLGGTLVFLSTRSPGQDTETHLENVALLRQIKQLDARWELDVLKARMGLSTDYDSLVGPLEPLGQLQQQVQLMAGGREHGALALANSATALRQAIDHKTRLIEAFKSHNAVLRNSLAFLPTAAADIRAALGRLDRRNSNRPGEVLALVNDLLLDVMVYSHATTEEQAADIQQDRAQLMASRPGLPAPLIEQLDLFSAHVAAVVREQLVVSKLLTDIAAVPTAAHVDALDKLVAQEHRQTSERGEQHRRYLLAFASAVAALFLYAAASLIRSHAEINRVNRALRGANAALEQRVEERTAELRAAQGELVAAARQAGMAEIANNVLHNVGNVLNSVNVSVGMLSQRLHKSGLPRLRQAVAMIQDAADPGAFLSQDPRGKALPAYMARLMAAHESEQQALQQELAAVVRSVDHIKDIVASQQAHAGAACVVEITNVAALVDDALRISAASLSRHTVMVIKEIAEVPMLLLDRHRLLQILVNLINNAKQAMAGMVGPSPRLTLGVEMAERAEGSRLILRVADQGIGISPEHQTLIFSHGFTTRSNGHGFGLHSSVLAAREMGGQLGVHSAGIGHGATFTLELPAQMPGATG